VTGSVRLAADGIGGVAIVSPELAVLVSSFERPQHLARVLASIECQQAVDGRFEVVVTDDGSTDATREVVREFASRVDFPVAFTTHQHAGYQLARCRNEGVIASRAPYLLFLDGDCLIPATHLHEHLKRRQVGVVWGGYCCLLDRDASQRLTIEDIYAGRFCQLATRSERRKLLRLARRAWLYNLINHPTKPKLFGGNVAMFRSDYERVNGYDENFRGWGCEDDDLRLRLRLSGVRIRSILRWTCTYHLWHPPGETTPRLWREGANVAYLRRRNRQACCDNGLSRRRVGESHFAVERWNTGAAAGAGDLSRQAAG
jgi:glycosyltransferase involved in cell wall biosynthesis